MIYFDNAATTFPKPTAVVDEMFKCMEEYCGNPGRSSHKMSVESAKKIYECRCEVSSFFGCDLPENVVFTYNTTYALNMALRALAKQGDHILISDYEHNSVLRPVASLGSSKVEFSSYSALGKSADEIINNIELKLRPNTNIIIINHSSNICSYTAPLKEIGRFCREKKLTLIVDAAQSAGHVKIDMDNEGISVLCAPFHKGLYGPQGGGFLIFNSEYSKINKLKNLQSVFQGGNGINSLDILMPDVLPEKLETGTPATPNIAGLLEGIKFVKSVGIDYIRDKEDYLAKRLICGLNSINGIETYGDYDISSGIVLLNVKNVPSAKVADELDKFDICVRAGFHCCPLGHKVLKTGTDGALRVSFGIYNNTDEVDEFLYRLNTLVKDL